MGATGVRGLRVANEIGIPVTINDRDPATMPLIQENVTRSGLPVTVTCRDACSLLFEQAFDAVDIDPFGTPAPFIDAGIRGCRCFLLVTATDTDSSLRGTFKSRHPPVFCPTGQYRLPR